MARSSPGRLRGKVFVFLGQLGDYCDAGHAARLVKAAGGTVARSLDENTDVLVLGNLPLEEANAARNEAVKLIWASNATIQIVTEDAFLQLITPSASEAMALLRSGPQGPRTWRKLFLGGPPAAIDFSGRDLRDVPLHKVALDGCTFRHANLEGVDLRMSSLWGCDFTGANLRRARVQEADLSQALLVNADLTETDLRRANLEGVDLTGATVTGALLEYTPLFNVEFGAGQFAHRGVIGAHMSELQALAQGAAHLRTTADLTFEGKSIKMLLEARHGKTPPVHVYWQAGPTGVHGSSQSLLNGLIKLANTWGRGELHVDTIKVRRNSGALKDAASLKMVVGAWCEAFGAALPGEEQLEELQQQRQRQRGKERDRLLALLEQGSAGVRQWNASAVETALVRDFRHADLAERDLSGAVFSCLDLKEANFAGANLHGAAFVLEVYGIAGKPCVLKDATFRGADLRDSSFDLADCRDAVFDDARMNRASLRGCNFRKASFRNTDLRRADLGHTDLRGADLALAMLDRADFEAARYDDRTLFPAGFTVPDTMEWKGKGAAPQAATTNRGDPWTNGSQS